MLKKIWDNFEKYFLIIMLGFSCCLVLYQIIMRYIFNQGLSWSEELARYLFIWEIWIGIAYATKRRSHLRITMIRDRLPLLAKTGLETAVIIGWFCFGAFLTHRGFSMCIRVAALGQQSAALRIPMQYVYAGIPVGALLMNIHLIENFILLLKETKQSQKEAGTNE